MRRPLCAIATALAAFTMSPWPMAWGEDLPKPTPSQRELVDSLSQANLQETFRILLRDYIQREDLSSLEINRAALQGLLGRLGLGAELVARASNENGATNGWTTVSELLPRNIGYLRPAHYAEEAIAKTDAALAEFREAGAETLILDLRCPMPKASFEASTAFLSRFCPANTVLFKIARPGETKPRPFLSRKADRWKGEILLLVDHETGNVSETVAGVIRHFNDAFVIGERTTGRTVRYQRININEKAALRFAVAEVLLPDGTSIFQKGIHPNLVSLTKPETKRAVFKRSEEEGVALFVIDKERPVLNEAALVAGTNPELPLLLERSAGKQTEFDTVRLQDRTLQQATEFLAARRFLGE